MGGAIIFMMTQEDKNSVLRMVLTQTLRPTHQMAMKWLREIHRKYIDIRYNNQNEEYRFIVFTMVKDKPIDFIHSEYHSTYEEAVEAALKYCLTKLI